MYSTPLTYDGLTCNPHISDCQGPPKEPELVSITSTYKKSQKARQKTAP